MRPESIAQLPEEALMIYVRIIMPASLYTIEVMKEWICQLSQL